VPQVSPGLRDLGGSEIPDARKPKTTSKEGSRNLAPHMPPLPGLAKPARPGAPGDCSGRGYKSTFKDVNNDIRKSILYHLNLLKGLGLIREAA
jgi:hypothetical protein